jgi:HlyD family secretion protein
MGAAVVIGVALAALAFLRPGGAELEVVHPRRGEIRESFREPAQTRLENTWTIAAQVPGRIGRIALEPGDRVEVGQVLAEYDLTPLEAAVEEAGARVSRLQAQLDLIEDSSVERADLAAAEARLRSSIDRIKAYEAQVEAAKARVVRSQKDLTRSRELVEVGALDPQSLDAQEMAATEAEESLKQARAELEAQTSTVESERSNTRMIEKRIGRKALERREVLAQLEEARAQEVTALHNLDLARIVAPIDGVVLERFDRGEKPVAQGTPLLLLGNPDDIEVIADVLSEDALNLNIGDQVALEELSGQTLTEGRVKLIEPQGFTKLSSLGVEQQRVNVIVELENKPKDLGIGYRLHARFFTGTRKGVLMVPRYTVLQAPDQSFYVFIVEGGRLRKQPVTPGLKSDLLIEVIEGLTEESQVVASPDSTLKEGTAVSPVAKDFKV